jgi:hypothetical protein
MLIRTAVTQHNAGIEYINTIKMKMFIIIAAAATNPNNLTADISKTP